MQRQQASYANRSRYQNHKPHHSANITDMKSIVKTLPVLISKVRMADYQREVDMKRVSKIVKEYNPHRDRPIEVSYRDGEYWCFDGQHRTRAHEMMGMDSILAQVHYGLSYRDEAALFARQHDNVQSVGIKDRWEAAVKSGSQNEPEVHEIIKICKEMGFNVSTASSNKKNTFSCVRELQKIYSKHKRNGLLTAIWLVDTAWHEKENNTHHDIVAGICKLMDTYKLDDKAWERLAKQLSKVADPKEFLRRANTAQGRGGKRTAIRMVQEYNNGLSLSGKNRLNEYLIK